MSKYVILVVLGALFLSACGDETIILPGDQDNQIHVAGTATIKAPPDIATVEIGVLNSWVMLLTKSNISEAFRFCTRIVLIM